MNNSKRILIYGFGPYRQFRENITAKIVRSLPRRPGFKKIIFPVRFHRKQFVDAIRSFKPDMILGLGQSTRQKIDVESQAMNRRRSGRMDKLRPILLRGPKRLRTTLQLRAGRSAGKSANAGDYVCNFSMYVMLDHIERNGLSIPFGFIHIPHHHDARMASRLVVRLLGRVT